MTNIYEKLALIQQEATRLKKEGDLELGGKVTKFLRVDDILDMLRPLLVEHKVIVMPSLVEAITTTYTAQEPPSHIDPAKWSGRIAKFQTREKVTYDFMFIDTENPESRHSVRVLGEAMDTQDKASGKAFTSCQKSMLVKVFNLVTGEPEIEDSNQDTDTMREPAGPSAGQQKIMQARGADPVRQVTEQTVTGQATVIPVDNSVDTDDDQKGKLRAELRDLQGKYSLTMQQVNFLASAATGKETRAEWFTKVAELKKVVALLADDGQREAALNTAATGEV